MDFAGLINTNLLKVVSNISVKNEIEIYIVGGAVRDYILYDKTKKDIDILVIGDGIKFSKLIATKLNCKVQIFKNYGTAMIKVNGVQLEFVGARKESYDENSRNPSVSNGTLEDDLSRRDFTLNALAVGLSNSNKGKLIDLFDGIKHLNQGILKTPKNPHKTFYDDPLRMLRAIRFACQHNFKIDIDDFKCITSEHERIKIISKERINEELNKILMTNNPSVGFKLLYDSKLLSVIIPELCSLKGIEEIEGKKHKDNFFHTLQVVDNISKNTDNIWLRWVALLHDIGKPKSKRFNDEVGWTFHGHEFIGSKMVNKIFKRMRLPLNDKLKYVSKLILLSSRPIVIAEDSTTDSAVRRLIYDAGDDIDDLLTLCEADITTKNEFLQKKYLNNFNIVREKIKIVEERDRIRNFQPPVTGEDIMRHFNIKPCKEIGMIKNYIKESILNGKIQNSNEEALKLMIEKGKELGL